VISVVSISGVILVSLYNLGCLILGPQVSFLLVMEIIVEGLVHFSEMLVTTFRTVQNLITDDHNCQLTVP
jgi:hypothetical protein